MKKMTVAFLTLMLLAGATAQAYTAVPCAGMMPAADAMSMGADRSCCTPGACDCKMKATRNPAAVQVAAPESRTETPVVFKTKVPGNPVISGSSVDPSRSKKVLRPKDKIYDLLSDYRI